jgi:quercetin dioxygenase-like cupin family protein
MTATGVAGRSHRRAAVLGCTAIAAASLLWARQSGMAPPFADQLHGGMAHAQASAAMGGEGRRPGTSIRPISCERLPNVPGKSISTVIVDYPPGAYTPRHRHPGFVMAFVLAGTLRSQLAGGPVGTYGAGQSWSEPPGTVHLFAENASATEPAELLATFIADDDCGPLVIPG